MDDYDVKVCSLNSCSNPPDVKNPKRGAREPYFIFHINVLYSKEYISNKEYIHIRNTMIWNIIYTMFLVWKCIYMTFEFPYQIRAKMPFKLCFYCWNPLSNLFVRLLLIVRERRCRQMAFYCQHWTQCTMEGIDQWYTGFLRHKIRICCHSSWFRRRRNPPNTGLSWRHLTCAWCPGSDAIRMRVFLGGIECHRKDTGFLEIKVTFSTICSLVECLHQIGVCMFMLPGYLAMGIVNKYLSSSVNRRVYVCAAWLWA